MAEGDRRRTAPRAGAAAGLTGAGVSLLAAAVVHTALPMVPFPPIPVAEAVVRATPGGVATFFIELLHHLALPLVVVGTTLGYAGAGALLGLLLPRLSAAFRGWAFPASLLLGTPLYAVAVLALRADPGSVGRGAYALALLPVLGLSAWATSRSFERVSGRSAAPASGEPDRARRAVLRAVLVGGAGLVLGWTGLGRLVSRRPNPALLPLRVRDLTPAGTPTPAPGDAAFTNIAGLSPEITPIERFYVVDEEIIDPDVDPASWRLRVGGLVDRPFELTYEELLDMPAVERFVTLECISNPVGGDLISTARWTGIPLPALLGRAGILPGAVEVVARAVGGYSDSIPVGEAMAPSTLIAVGMNGRVLPREHGYPARLLVPGRYGMKQPKWLEEIEVVDRPHTGYWEERGWSKAAFVKTMARIDTPAEGTAASGSLTIAGVAFAGNRGIAQVEVSTDGGRTWEEAELKTALSNETWRLWRYRFEPAGPFRALARAVDGTGAVQVQQVVAPHPSGASGYDEVAIGGA